MSTISRPHSTFLNQSKMRHSMEVDLLSTHNVGGKTLLMSPLSIGDSYRSDAVRGARDDFRGTKGKGKGKQLEEPRRSIPSIATIADMAPKIVAVEQQTTKAKRRSSTDLPQWWKVRIVKERQKLLEKPTTPTNRRASWHSTPATMREQAPKQKTTSTARRPSMVVDVDMLHEKEYAEEKKQEVCSLRHKTLMVGQLMKLSLRQPAGTESITPSTTFAHKDNSELATIVGGLFVAILLALDMTGQI